MLICFVCIAASYLIFATALSAQPDASQLLQARRTLFRALASQQDASTSDVVVNISVPAITASGTAIGVSVLANVSNGNPFGSVLTMVNFTAPDACGTMNAMTSIRTLDPCASSLDAGSPTTAHFRVLAGETSVEIRMLVDCSIVEVFVMGGRVVFTQMFNPAVLYVPDTNVALHSWGTDVIASFDVFSMGCGWTNAPYQPNPTMESVSDF